MVDIQERRFPVMGTTAHVVIVDGPSDLAEQASTRLQQLEARWSRFLPSSELSALHRYAGRPTIVSTETFTVVAQAIDAWHKTDGLFDPTVGNTMIDAGYDRSFDRLDTGVATGSGLHRPTPTPQDVILDQGCQAITVPDGIRLDLGGIGKGAAADLVAAEMLAGGALGCSVNVGGDVRVVGRSPRPGGWRVAIAGGITTGSVDHTGDLAETAPVAVGLSDGAVCTSTTTKRRWSGPAGPENHLRLPTTGAAAASGLATVSIICASATQGEVLTKAALLSGPIEGAARVSDAKATGLFITDTGEQLRLEGFDRFMAKEHPATVA